MLCSVDRMTCSVDRMICPGSRMSTPVITGGRHCKPAR
jgi:hypothetical protein